MKNNTEQYLHVLDLRESECTKIIHFGQKPSRSVIVYDELEAKFICIGYVVSKK